jgi:thiol:disulfide interchange protein DsbC
VAVASADEARILEKLRAAWPRTTIDAVRATPIAGLYEVVMGRNIAYVGEDPRYMLFGSLYDMQASLDLTAERKQSLRSIDFSILPLRDAITIKRGNGSRVLAVFSDPDCPYCKRLEQELEKLDDVTIHVFPYPLDMHPKAREKSISVWCSRDRAKAWTQMMLQGKVPAKAKCEHPIDRNIALAARLGIEGTPELFNASGQRLSGVAPAHVIDRFIDGQQ